MKITMVGRIDSNGQLCAKSLWMLEDLRQRELAAHIDRFVMADDRNIYSEGSILATHYQMKAIPFFIVHNTNSVNGLVELYKSYQDFLQEVFGESGVEDEKSVSRIAQNIDSEYIYYI
jgi:hypothetical protein